MPAVPQIDISALAAPAGGLSGEPGPDAGSEAAVGRALDEACRTTGFFTITGHGIPMARFERTAALARAFFALPAERKQEIAMARSGRAWRGWFPPGGELTSGRPDGKEGIYFGREGPAGDPRALHGPNLFPEAPAELRGAVCALMDDLERCGQRLLRALALGLGCDAGFFARELTADPVVLMRIFHYPHMDTDWGVGEHTDYGLLTLLWQDASGGLEVRLPNGAWTAIPPERNALVCNVGDMLDRLTGGRYRSTPHRVRPTGSGRGRISIPFFLDPSWDAEVRPIPHDQATPPDDADTRWDGTSVHEGAGTYGDYLTAKVAKVFPALAREALDRAALDRAALDRAAPQPGPPG